MFPYVSDFGLARAANVSLKGDTLTGTRIYSSPLALGPKNTLSVRDDVFSFGVILEEMLIGRSEIQRNNLERGQQESSSELADNTRSALLVLAQRCRAADPSARPSDFREVFENIIQLAPTDQWPGPDSMHHQEQKGSIDKAKRQNAKVNLIARRVGTLIELEEPEAALELISKAEIGDWRLWRYQGMAFSRIGKLYKAVWCYHASLDALESQTNGSPSAADYHWTQFFISEALLRRGKKYRAIVGLKKLVDECTDQHVKEASVHTLAWAYIEKRWFRHAEWLLRDVQFAKPSAQHWNNLGVVYLRLEEFEQAADAYTCAVELEPWNAKHHLGVGQALMMIPDRIPQALEGIDRAIGCGDLTPTTFVCAFVCAFLLSDTKKVRGLRTMMHRNYPTDEVRRFEDAALQKAMQVPFRPFVHIPQAPSDKRWAERSRPIMMFRTDTASKLLAGESVQPYKLKVNFKPKRY